MRTTTCYLAMLCVLTVPAFTAAENLLVCDSSTDQVFLFSGQDGSLINSSFLDVATQVANAGLTSSIPIEALEVGNEIWVSDQNADRVWRFARDRSYLGAVGVGQMDNIRGMEVVGNTVYVAQSGSTATTGEGIVTIDVPSLTVTGSFNGRDDADTSYWDVKHYNGELLVTNSDSGNDGIERYALDGTFLGFFAQSDGVNSFDFLQQLNERQTNTNLLAGGFSPPSGVYEFLSDGTNLGIIAGLDFGPRAAYELGNGQIAWTNGAQFGTDSVAFGAGSFRFINPTSIPEPTGLTVLVAIAFGACVRRKR